MPLMRHLMSTGWHGTALTSITCCCRGLRLRLRYIDDIRRFTNAPVLYYGARASLRSLRLEAAVKSDRGIAQAADEMERTERDIWRRVDAVLYPSQEEADTVSRIEPEVAACLAPIYCFDTFQARAEAP